MRGRTSVAEELETPSGIARVHLSGGNGRGLVLLGHGAGGGVEAPDLLAVTAALQAAGWDVARVEQPDRVQGRRAPAPAAQLDAAWTAVAAALRSTRPGPLVTGGRSSGARVACRTAAVTEAAAVVCLAFPLRPPRRPDVTRADELSAGGRPVLVVQGERDPFGGPAAFPPGPTVVAVPGDHSLRRSAPLVARAVVEWLDAQSLT
ncbi:MAG TPA: alpha/beta family hydrolase [Mycobacteriales bacterium]|nr:alpha/beta family hydrolase [Mycobacteriales bacterium]